jgi:RHS repeat-associated protein
MVRLGVLFVLVQSLFVHTVLAQESGPITTQGIPPFSLISHAGGGLDSINLGNLGILLSIPINSNGPYGPKSSATLLMESGFPLIKSGSSILMGTYVPFQLQGLSYLPAHYSGSGFLGTGCNYSANGAMDASRAYHQTPGLTLTTCGTLSVSGIGHDGWQIACCADGTGHFNYFTIAPNGNYSTIVEQRLFDLHAPPNYIKFTQTPTSQTFTDAAGNETAQAAMGWCCSNTFFIPQTPITYPGPGNTSSTYSLGWNFWTGNSNASCGSSHPPGQPQETMPFLTSMQLPDGTHYSFTYEQYWNTTNMYTGRIQSITLPTGATISYTYSGGTQNEGVWCDDGSAATILKTTPDGTWTFTHCEYGLATPPTTCNTIPPTGWTSNRLATTTVTEPSGDYKIYTTGSYVPADPGEKVVLPIQLQSFGVTGPGCSASSPCNLGSQVICYSGDLSFPACAVPTSVPSGAITETDVYTYVPGVTNPSLTVHTADSYERPTQTRVYGFGGTRSGTNWDTKTTIAYGSWSGSSCATVTGTITGTSVTFPVMDRVCYKQLFVGGGSTAVSTSYYTYNATGDLVTQQDTIGGVLVTTASNQYDSLGRLTSSTGPNGESTSTAYTACSGQEPSSTTVTTGSHASLTTNYTSYDCTGERLLVKQDANLNNWTTSYIGDPFWRPMSTTDPMGNTTYNTYTPSLSSSQHATGDTKLTVASGSVEETLTQLDSMGRQQLSQVKLNGTNNYSITETDRDTNGRVSRRTIPFTAAAGTLNPSVAAFTYTYDGLDRMLTETSPPYSSTIAGTMKTYTYIANDTEVTVSPTPSGENTKSTNTEVNGLGELTSVCEITSAAGSSGCGQSNTTASGFLTTYAYYPGGKLQTITQNAKGATTQLRSFTYDNSNTGRMLTVTTPESGTTTTTYDSDPSGYCPSFTGFPVKTVDNGGGTTCMSYDLADRVVGRTYPTGLNSNVTPAKEFIYDATSNPNSTCSQTNAAGGLAEVQTGVVDYGSVDISGQEQSTVSGTPSTGSVTLTFYAGNSYAGTIIIYVNGTNVGQYNFPEGLGGGTIAQALSNAINGNSNSPVTSTWSGGTGPGEVYLTSKAVGSGTNYSLSATCQPSNGTPCSSFVTTSGSTMTGGTGGGTIYDSGSVWITVNGIQTSVSYGQNSTATTVATALANAINGNSSLPVTATLLGPVVNLTLKSGSSGNGLTSGSSTSQSTYFANPSFTTTDSPGLGQLATDELFCYDKDGRRSDAFLWTSAGHGVYEHTSESYYPDGQISSLSVPTQPTINYSLDPNGRVLSATASSGLSPILTSVSYYDNGLPNIITLGTGDTSTYAPWANLQPYTATHTFGTGTNNTITHSLTWNSNGTLASLATTDQPNPANSQTCSFSYDDLERVVTNNCGSNWNESYSYDVFGNITKSGSAPWPTSGTYNQSTNRYSSTAFIYDANGRLTNDTFDTLGWDVNGNLISQSGTNFVYDAFNRPVMGGTTQYLYGPKGDLVATENSSGVITKMFVPLPMSRAVYASGSLGHYDRYDWQHSVRVSSTASRSVYSDTSYDAFGIPYWSAGTANSQYAGLGSDISSGTEQVSATRRYHPTQGRWISPDSWGLAAVDMATPQSFNRYAYVGNNPLLRTDPGGQCWPPAVCGLILMNWGNQIINWGNSTFGPSGMTYLTGSGATNIVGGLVKQVGSGLTAGTSSGAAWDSGNPYQRTLALADDMGKVGSDILLLAPVGQAANSVLAPVAETALGASSAADASLSGVGTDMSVATRGGVTGFGPKSGFFNPPTTNAAGGTVYASTGEITQPQVGTIINSALIGGEPPINIITGAHGTPTGGTVIDETLFCEDLNAYGSQPNVRIYNYVELTAQDISSLVNGPGTTICALCNSQAVLNNLNIDISGLGDLGDSGIEGLGEVGPDQ